MLEQEPIMYFPYRHEGNFKESSLNNSASTLLDSGASGRPFTSFSGQSSNAAVFNHGAFNNVQGNYNMQTLPGALSSRNASLGGSSSGAIHQPSGGLPGGRFPANNLPIGLSQLPQHGHNSMTNRAALSGLGNHPLSTSMNGGGVSGPSGPVSLGSRGNIAGLAGSLSQMGAAGPRVQTSAGNMVGGAVTGNLNRTLSSGGGLPSLSSRMNMGPINSAGGGPASGRAMSPMLQQGVSATYNPSGDLLAMISRVQPQVVSLLGPSFSSSSGSGMQAQLPSANGQIGNLGLGGEGNQNEGSPFDINVDFPVLGNRQNAGLQGPVAFRKQGVNVNSLGQQNQEFSIQNEDFPALPGFKAGGNSDLASELHSKDSSMGVMQHFGMGRSSGFPMGVSFVARPQQQHQIVSGASTSLATGDSNLSHVHGTDNFPSSHGLSASFHSQMHTSGQGGGGSLGGLRSASPAGYDQLMHQYEHHQQPAFRLNAHPQQQLTAVGQPSGLRPMQDIQADRFGLLGLLSVIRMTDPDLTMLALGTDLTTLGLNLNSRENLYKTFASPWADGPVKGEPEFTLPQCYVQQAPTLQPANFRKFPQETLFYIFYSMPKDEAQILAAAELCNKGWHFHKGQRMWFTRIPGVEPSVKTATGERGMYVFFDPNIWETTRKENFLVSYDMVEAPPTLKPATPPPQ